MDTVGRVEELMAERNLNLFRLATISDVPYSTLKNTQIRGGQFSIDTIEHLCKGLGITMAEFFAGV